MQIKYKKGCKKRKRKIKQKETSAIEYIRSIQNVFSFLESVKHSNEKTFLAKQQRIDKEEN